MRHAANNPVVHLELHTGNLARACGFYARLFKWRTETIHAGSGSYVALEPGDCVGGGVVECDTSHPLWLPYVEVADVSRPQSARACWEPRYRSSRARGQPAGAASSTFPPAAKSPSGNRRR
jgi:predicted enzyme related to lactoylglutathione lyase